MKAVKGFFDKNPDSNSDWINPGSVGQFREWVDSKAECVVIYKHSYRCGTCLFTKMKAERAMQQAPDHIPFLFIDVISDRNLSEFIAGFTGIRHESPQLIILRNGEPVWHASHTRIDMEQILQALGEK